MNPLSKAATALADLIIVGTILILAIVPVIVLLLLAFTEEWGPGMLGEFTIRWVLDIPRVFGKSFLNSLLVAAIATSVTLVLSSLTAYASISGKVKIGMFMDWLITAPLTLSYIVLGLALIMAFNRPPLMLHGTVFLLVIGHIVICLPLSYRTVLAVMEGADLRLIEAARSLGASEWVAVRRVLLPVIAPGLVASSLLAFITSLQNFSMSFMIAPESFRTVPLEIFARLFSETGTANNYNVASAVGLFLMLLILGALWLVRVVTKQSWYENVNI